MTAPPTQLFHTPQFSTAEVAADSALLQWAHNELNFESKKRRRQFIEEIEQETPPPEKSPRKNDYQGDLLVCACDTLINFFFFYAAQEIDTSKMSRNDILLAYKRIWDNLDITNPTDAKLEPFVWHKIREYQKNK